MARKRKVPAASKKANAVIQGIAKRTGVAPAKVRNVLIALGLERALEHRAYVDKTSGTKSLKNVSYKTVRIATKSEQV